MKAMLFLPWSTFSDSEGLFWVDFGNATNARKFQILTRQVRQLPHPLSIPRSLIQKQKSFQVLRVLQTFFRKIELTSTSKPIESEGTLYHPVTHRSNQTQKHPPSKQPTPNPQQPSTDPPYQPPLQSQPQHPTSPTQLPNQIYARHQY